MKRVRTCIADAYVMEQTMRYIADCADDKLSQAEHYKARAKEAEENGDDATYWYGEVNELEAKAAAFERLLTKLSK